MSQTRILALVGSLRAASVNRRLAEAAAHTAPEGVEVTLYEGLADIPFYNEDIDVPGSVPAAAQALRDAVAEADGLLVVTPEYNGTLSAVLKNAIDWASRPYGAGAIKAKPTAVVSRVDQPERGPVGARRRGQGARRRGSEGGRVRASALRRDRRAVRRHAPARRRRGADPAGRHRARSGRGHARRTRVGVSSISGLGRGSPLCMQRWPSSFALRFAVSMLTRRRVICATVLS